MESGWLTHWHNRVEEKGKAASISVANSVTVDIVDSHMQKNMDWSGFFNSKASVVSMPD